MVCYATYKIYKVFDCKTLRFVFSTSVVTVVVVFSTSVQLFTSLFTTLH